MNILEKIYKKFYPKYKFTGKTKEVDGVVLKEIQLLRCIGIYCEEYVGGWIESEENLSHFGECFVEYEGSVSGKSRVVGGAVVYANVSGDSTISGYSKIYENVISKNIGSIFKGGYHINYSGKDQKGKHYVRVGCQCHTIEQWRREEFRQIIIKEWEFPSNLVPVFLKILDNIEKEYCGEEK